MSGDGANNNPCGEETVGSGGGGGGGGDKGVVCPTSQESRDQAELTKRELLIKEAENVISEWQQMAFERETVRKGQLDLIGRIETRIESNPKHLTTVGWPVFGLRTCAFWDYFTYYT